MVKRYLKVIKGCQIEKIKTKNKVIFKCKNLKRSPKDWEIIEVLIKKS